MERFGKMKETCQSCYRRIIGDLRKYGWIGILMIAYYFVMHGMFHAFCPMVIITGFPCPGCGMVRAILVLFGGEVKRSLLLNPTAMGWVILTAWILIRRYWQGKKITGLKQAGIGLIILMIIIYIYRMAVEFPGRAPMTFRYDNILDIMFPGYTQIMTSLF